MKRPVKTRSTARQAGIVYVGVLILLLLLSVMGAAFLFTVRIQTMATSGRLDAIQADYLAESAANHAVWRLLHESDNSVSVYISQTADDVHQDYDNNPDLFNSKLELGKREYIGLRFNHITIPQGETITLASIQFMASDDDNEVTDVTIYGHDADSPPAFTEEENLGNRPRTSESVPWANIPRWKKEMRYDSPDLTPIVQELVNRPGWASGNSMAFLLRSNNSGGERRCYARDDGSRPSAMLVVTYGDQRPMTAITYTMHGMDDGSYGYKVRRPTAGTFATIATVGAVGEATAHQSYVVYIEQDRRPIDIVNPGGELSDYQVKVKLTTDKLGSPYDGINADGSDLRFADSAGVDLPYWIENWNRTDSSTIWVRVPFIPAGDSAIYLVYGKSVAISQSDGVATFLYFDSFEEHSDGDVPDNWQPPSLRVKKDDGVMALDDTEENGAAMWPTDARAWDNVAVRQRFRSNSGVINRAGVILRRRNDDNMLCGGVSEVNVPPASYPKACIYSVSGGVWHQISPDWRISDVSSGWHIQELAIDGDTIDFRLNDSYVGSATTEIGDPDTGGTGFWSQQRERAYRDWHLVRRYRSPEPTATLR